MSSAYTLKNITTALTVSALLSACGGGGGSDDGSSGTATPARTTISESQAFPVVQTVNSNISAILDGAIRGASSLDRTEAVAQSVAGAKGSKRAIDENPTLRVLKLVTGSRSQAIVTGVVENVRCDSGFIEVSINQKNPDALSAGDTLSVVSRDCVIQGDRFIGEYSLNVGAVRGTLFSETSAYGLTITATYKNFGIVTADNSSASLTGAMTFAVEEDPARNTYALNAKGASMQGTVSLRGAQPQTAAITNFTIQLNGNVDKNVISYTGDVHGNSSRLGSYRYNVATPTAFTTFAADQYPTSGVSVIKGSNAFVTVTAVDKTSFRIDYTDANGTKSQVKPWSELSI